MRETRLELTAEEEQLLARLARERGLSKADLLRRALALLAREDPAASTASGEVAEVRRRVGAMAGGFGSADGGSVQAHDDWLVEAYRA